MGGGGAFYLVSCGLFRINNRGLYMNLSDISKAKLQKMLFIMSALEKGWSIKKRDDSYVFTKKHENRKEVLMENYLEQFVLENASIGEDCILPRTS